MIFQFFSKILVPRSEGPPLCWLPAFYSFSTIFSNASFFNADINQDCVVKALSCTREDDKQNSFNRLPFTAYPDSKGGYPVKVRTV